MRRATDLLKVLTELDSGGLGLEIAQLKNKFASPTPLGYRDMNLNVSVASTTAENILPRSS